MFKKKIDYWRYEIPDKYRQQRRTKVGFQTFPMVVLYFLIESTEILLSTQKYASDMEEIQYSFVQLVVPV